MTDRNASRREMLNTKDPQSIRILHRARIAEKKLNRFLCVMGALCPCSFFACKKAWARNSMYLQVHENRVEFNSSVTTQAISITGLIEIAKLAPAPLPMAMHAVHTIFPVANKLDKVRVLYFDATLILYKNGPCGCPCCRKWEYFEFLEDADEVVSAIQAAQQAHKAYATEMKKEAKLFRKTQVVPVESIGPVEDMQGESTGNR
eukprot:m51a1_g9608 hypothetical protein (204) ;mRNA; f:1065599-1066397